jgi:hypothetical protein
VDIPLGDWNHRVEFVSDLLLKLQRRELARDETVLVAHKATMQHAEPYNHRWVDESCHNYRIGQSWHLLDRFRPPFEYRRAGPQSQNGCQSRSAFLLSECELSRRAPDDSLPASGAPAAEGVLQYFAGLT